VNSDAKVCVGLIGDFDASVTAHRAIPLALQLAAQQLNVAVSIQWLPTDQLDSESALPRVDGWWCVPASPYRSQSGALRAIRHAREQGQPFLGTCGGFQHAILDYARNVLGWSDATHAEDDPGAGRAVIAALQCSLVEVRRTIHLAPQSRLATAYRTDRITEGYHCSYGLNPEFQSALVAAPLRATATDDNGEIRAVELDAHPFFVATLFQPERAALTGLCPPVVTAFLAAIRS
jgi:CTP synthase (UTP-ammonia lyase)